MPRKHPIQTEENRISAEMGILSEVAEEVCKVWKVLALSTNNPSRGGKVGNWLTSALLLAVVSL